MHADAPPLDPSPPSTGADVGLALAMLGVILALPCGVLWAHGVLFPDAEAPPATWMGALAPVVSGVSGGVLLGLRRAYPDLPRLRALMTRTAWTGFAAAAAFAVLFARALL